MNRTLKAMAAIMLMMVFAVGCTKPDEPNNGGGNNQNDSIVDPNNGGGLNGHEFVDLGLPSGTLWATCNVGANSPEEYGDYFAWGETEPKDVYNWDTYKWCNGSYDQLTKYCFNSDLGLNGFVDFLPVLEAIDDAAAANWGDAWCMPNQVQWYELLENTSQTWTRMDSVCGMLLTGPNGNSIFFPAGGYRKDDEVKNVGSTSYYWGVGLERFELESNDEVFSPKAYNCCFNEEGSFLYDNLIRRDGLSIRAVRSRNLDGNGYVDLGLPSGTLWATCNVGANLPEEYGNYYAWGETEPKTIYNWDSYKWSHGDSEQLTKYCTNADYGYNGFTDNLTVLEACDDAAATNLGNDWCMPSDLQWEELACYSWKIWTTKNGVNGLRFIGPNGHSVFLPAEGVYDDYEGLIYQGDEGYYWSSGLVDINNRYATNLRFYVDDDHWNGCYLDERNWEGRDCGCSVRPVRSTN